MVRYDNGNFYMKRVRFRIPNNFFINSDPESTDEYFIELRPPENDYILRVRILDECKSTFLEICNYFSEDAGGTPAEPPSAISVGGMVGHHVIVNGDTVKTANYYAHLAIPDSKDEHFYYYIEVKDGKRMRSILDSPEIKWFVDNIQFI